MTINDLPEDIENKIILKRMEQFQIRYLDMKINLESYELIIKEYEKLNDEESKQIVKENQNMANNEKKRMKMVEISFNNLKCKVKEVKLKLVDPNDLTQAENVEKLTQNGKDPANDKKNI